MSKFLNLKLQDMELRCKFHPHGCEVWVRVKDAYRHESRCAFACSSDVDSKENAYTGAEKLNCSDCKTKLVLCREGCGRVMSGAEAKRHSCVQGLLAETRKKAENLRCLREKLAVAVREKNYIEEQLYELSQAAVNEAKSLENSLKTVENEKLRAEEEYEVPGARYLPAVRLGRWNGKVSFFSLGGSSYVNLLPKILPFIDSRDYDIELEDLRVVRKVIVSRNSQLIQKVLCHRRLQTTMFY